jgi:hypothetical protein
MVELPKGASSEVFAGLPCAVVITRAIAEVKDREGKVIVGNQLEDLRVIVP